MPKVVDTTSPSTSCWFAPIVKLCSAPLVLFCPVTSSLTSTVIDLQP